MRLRASFEQPTGQSHGLRSCASLWKHSWSTNGSDVTTHATKTIAFPSNSLCSGWFLHKDDMEGGNMKIHPQHLVCQPLYTFFWLLMCLSQMWCQDERSYANTRTLVNWRTTLHAHEWHGSVSWRCFFVYFTAPFVISYVVLILPQCHTVQ